MQPTPHCHSISHKRGAIHMGGNFSVLVLAIVLLFLTMQQAQAQALTFAMVAKTITNSPFFSRAERGCLDAAEALNATCIFTGSTDPNATDVRIQDQAEIVAGFIQNNTIDGLAISVSSVEVLAPLINQAVEAGIPVVTFDSDAPDSMRSAYVGTNNTFLGSQIAKVLKQLRPNGGTVGVISAAVPNIMEREDAFQYELLDNSNGVWQHAAGSPARITSMSEALNATNTFASLNLTGIALMFEGPMGSTQTWESIVDSHQDHDTVYVSADASLNQLDLLSRRKCHGLVGQLPYEMGYVSIGLLHKIVQGENVKDEVIGTNVLTHIQVPLILPPLTVDTNRIGTLAAAGYLLFGLTAAVAIGFSIWTYLSRKLQVVKASQPLFLIMVAAGILIMASSIIPLSFDDSNGKLGTTGICMSVPWLLFMGFTITFAAFYSKTRRINHIFHAGQAFSRVEIKPRHVLVPFLVLLSANAVVLICWTILDPLTYKRENHLGLDGWNRVISTYGTCRSEHGVRYLVPLACINLIVLAIANWQAYEARKIKSEFSESKYIGLAMASMLQCGVLGIPVLFVVRQEPEPFYLVLIFMIFIFSMAVLLLIFVPKIVLQDVYSRQDPAQQRRMILDSVQESQGVVRHHNGGGTTTRSAGSAAGNPSMNVGQKVHVPARAAAPNLSRITEETDESGSNEIVESTSGAAPPSQSDETKDDEPLHG